MDNYCFGDTLVIHKGSVSAAQISGIMGISLAFNFRMETGYQFIINYDCVVGCISDLNFPGL